MLASSIALLLVVATSFSYMMFWPHNKLYVKIAAVYEGKIDTRFWITKNSLENAKTFIGDALIINHDQKDIMSAVGKIIDADIRYDKSLKLYYIEVIAEVTDPLAIDKIQKALFNKVSIGFMPILVQCSLCSYDMLHCEHDPGHYYNGTLARGVVWQLEGLELSFVNIPASEHARTLEWSHSKLELSNK
jgi:hypothetical protein